MNVLKTNKKRNLSSATTFTLELSRQKIVKKKDGHISYIENDYNEFKLQYNKQSVKQILIQRAVKTTIQILYEKGLVDNYSNTDKILEDSFFTTRRRGDLGEIKDVVQ